MSPVGGLQLRRVVLAALCSALAAGTPASAPEPIRCAACSPERLSRCPAVAPGCAEVLREPGCGCCLACALAAGELCGIYTAPCGSGLRCSPRPGDPRPLHALTRGLAVCAAGAEPRSTPEPQHTQGRPPRGFPTNGGPRSRTFIHLGRADQAEPEAEMENAVLAPEPGSSHHLPGPGKPYDPRAFADVQEPRCPTCNNPPGASAGPCHLELQRALDRISKAHRSGEKLTRFYLPNCDKHGLYKPKQCESALDGQRPDAGASTPGTGR
uniref:Insulin-like growth factor binding protein 1a n=1 Tax=Tetraodon nigroviridis TaxID=99883 RepID=H3C4L8_TETNG